MKSLIRAAISTGTSHLRHTQSFIHFGKKYNDAAALHKYRVAHG